MSKAQTEPNNGPAITTYKPIFKDKLAKLENCGLGNGKQAQMLRTTIADVETGSSSTETGNGRRAK